MLFWVQCSAVRRSKKSDATVLVSLAFLLVLASRQAAVNYCGGVVMHLLLTKVAPVIQFV